MRMSTNIVPNLENVLEDDIFIFKFEEMFEKVILKLVKEYYNIKKLVSSNNDVQIIFAKDCCRTNIWRLKLFPLYKATRDHSKKKDKFDGKIFDYVYTVILPKLKKKYSCIHELFVENAEADDCIAVLTDVINTTNSSNDIIIITNDNDYLQLMDRVYGIYNLQGTSLRSKMLDNCSKKSMFSKILMGDPSDNIKGVLSKTKALKLLNTCDNVQDIDLILKNNLSLLQQEKLEINKQLIDFDNIPSEIRTNIISSYNDHTFINSHLCFCKSSIDEYEKNCTLPL